jgi:hypothetical protein
MIFQTDNQHTDWNHIQRLKGGLGAPTKTIKHQP